MNKKGQVAEGVLILAALIIASQAIFAAVNYQGTLSSGISTTGQVMDSYFRLEKDDLFHEESAKLAIQEAYATIIAEHTLAANCRSIISKGENMIVWDEGLCNPDNELTKSKFLELIDKHFERISDKKQFTISFNEDKLKFVPVQADLIDKFDDKFAKYRLTRKLFSEFELNYPDLDFEKIYFVAMSKRNTCANSLNCMQGLKIEGWSGSIKSETREFAYTWVSDVKYLYNGGYLPLELRFAVEKLPTTA